MKKANSYYTPNEQHFAAALVVWDLARERKRLTNECVPDVASLCILANTIRDASVPSKNILTSTLTQPNEETPIHSLENIDQCPLRIHDNGKTCWERINEAYLSQLNQSCAVAIEFSTSTRDNRKRQPQLPQRESEPNQKTPIPTNCHQLCTFLHTDPPINTEDCEPKSLCSLADMLCQLPSSCQLNPDLIGDNSLNMVGVQYARQIITSYIALALNCRDNVALIRVFNSPQRGMKGAVLQCILESAQNKHLSAYQVVLSTVLMTRLGGAYKHTIPPLLSQQHNHLADLVDTVEAIQNALMDARDPLKVVGSVINAAKRTMLSTSGKAKRERLCIPCYNPKRNGIMGSYRPIHPPCTCVSEKDIRNAADSLKESWEQIANQLEQSSSQSNDPHPSTDQNKDKPTNQIPTCFGTVASFVLHIMTTATPFLSTWLTLTPNQSFSQSQSRSQISTQTSSPIRFKYLPPFSATNENVLKTPSKSLEFSDSLELPDLPGLLDVLEIIESQNPNNLDNPITDKKDNEPIKRRRNPLSPLKANENIGVKIYGQSKNRQSSSYGKNMRLGKSSKSIEKGIRLFTEKENENDLENLFKVPMRSSSKPATPITGRTVQKTVPIGSAALTMNPTGQKQKVTTNPVGRKGKSANGKRLSQPPKLVAGQRTMDSFFGQVKRP